MRGYLVLLAIIAATGCATAQRRQTLVEWDMCLGHGQIKAGWVERCV